MKAGQMNQCLKHSVNAEPFFVLLVQQTIIYTDIQ